MVVNTQPKNRFAPKTLTKIFAISAIVFTTGACSTLDDYSSKNLDILPKGGIAVIDQRVAGLQEQLENKQSERRVASLNGITLTPGMLKGLPEAEVFARLGIPKAKFNILDMHGSAWEYLGIKMESIRELKESDSVKARLKGIETLTIDFEDVEEKFSLGVFRYKEDTSGYKRKVVVVLRDGHLEEIRANRTLLNDKSNDSFIDDGLKTIVPLLGGAAVGLAL